MFSQFLNGNSFAHARPETLKFAYLGTQDNLECWLGLLQYTNFIILWHVMDDMDHIDAFNTITKHSSCVNFHDDASLAFRGGNDMVKQKL